MLSRKTNQKGGLVKWIIILIALIALASYFFDFSVQDVVEDPQTQENFTYIWTNLKNIYDTYLAPALSGILNSSFIQAIIDNFLANLPTN